MYERLDGASALNWTRKEWPSVWLSSRAKQKRISRDTGLQPDINTILGPGICNSHFLNVSSNISKMSNSATLHCSIHHNAFAHTTSICKRAHYMRQEYISTLTLKNFGIVFLNVFFAHHMTL